MANEEKKDSATVTERVAKSLEEKTVRFTKDQLVSAKKIPCLNLDDLVETAAYVPADADDYMLIECEPSSKPTQCPVCHQSGCVVRNGYTVNPRLVHDVNVGLTQVDLSIRVPKYRCTNCGATPNHEFESIEHNRQFTKRLYKQIRVEAFTGNFEEIAIKFGISSSNVGFIFDDYAKELEEHRDQARVGTWLAMDEKHIEHKMRGVLVDGYTGRLLEITEDNSPASMERAIRSIKGYDGVRFVTTDMANGYRGVVEKVFGADAMLVVDKWHVLNDLQTKISKCRTSVIEYLNDTVPKEPESIERRRRMDLKKLAASDSYLFKYGDEKLAEKPTRLQLLAEICSIFPEYNHLRLLKEGFERIYDCEEKADAEALFKQWAKLVPPTGAKQRLVWEEKYGVPASLYDPIRPLKKTVETTWNREIFNYFLTGTERPLTNAIAEATNSFITRFSRDGYSFPRLRAKALFWHLVGTRPRYVLESRKQCVISLENKVSGSSDSHTTYKYCYGIYEETEKLRYSPTNVFSFGTPEQQEEWTDILMSIQ